MASGSRGPHPDGPARQLRAVSRRSGHRLGPPRRGRRHDPDLLAQVAGVDLRQDGGEQLDRLVLVVDVLRLGEDRDGADVGGQDLAVAVDDVSVERSAARVGLVSLVFGAVFLTLMGRLASFALFPDGASSTGCAPVSGMASGSRGA
jgi:hypothetical protein